MNQLNEFMKLLTGEFDNAEQFSRLKKEGVSDFPFAEHVNTACNDKIRGLPADFAGVFMIEESYYTLKDTKRASSHLFLFTEEPKGIRLTSYEIPEGYDKSNFTYAAFSGADYTALKPSAKFTPALYIKNPSGVWEGGSVSMFTPVLKFTLYERFSEKELEVSESMEVNGRKTFGYDVPILYKRKA